jgi:hypothetical protein
MILDFRVITFLKDFEPSINLGSTESQRNTVAFLVGARISRSEFIWRTENAPARAVGSESG